MHRNPCNSFFMVHMASGVDHGHGRPTNEKNRMLYNMAARLQLHVYVSHAALVYNVHLWYWTYMLWSNDTKVSLLTSITWPYRGLKFRAHQVQVFFLNWPLTKYWFWIGSLTNTRLTCWNQGQVSLRTININPWLKVSWSINFFLHKMFFTAYVLCSLKLLKLKREGQTI